MRGIVHHIDLTVKDAQASKAFYEAVLGFMGHKVDDERPGFIDFKLDGQPCYVGLVSARNDGTHNRYSPGLHHIAWIATDRADVDALHVLLQRINANILDAPAEYPQYSAGYYAVFFADPDGLKLEYVHKP